MKTYKGKYDNNSNKFYYKNEKEFYDGGDVCYIPEVEFIDYHKDQFTAKEIEDEINNQIAWSYDEIESYVAEGTDYGFIKNFGKLPDNFDEVVEVMMKKFFKTLRGQSISKALEEFPFAEEVLKIS